MSLVGQWVDVVDNVDVVKASHVNMIAAAVKTLEVSATVAPKIGVNGTWMIWSPATAAYIDTGLKAAGEKGEPGRGLIIEDIYDNYAALVAAFPTGNTNIYQTADTDNLYIWSAIRNQWTTLGNISPVTSAGTTTYDHNNTKLTAANVQDAIDQLANLIENGVAITPAVNLGMNSVIRKTDNVTSIPKFTIKGKSYTNLLGKDGNCEDVSKWSAYQVTPTLDTTSKVFGSNGYKLTLTSTTGNLYKQLSTIGAFDATKYYLISAYIKNGNATDIYVKKDNTSGGVALYGTTVTSTGAFTRVVIKCQPSDLNASNYINIYVDGISGQYAYVDGIMLNEITADEYNNLTTDQLMEKYTYVDSYACLENPYIEVRHDNLVRNGNGEEGIGWWNPRNTAIPLQIENGRFKGTNHPQWGSYIQIVKVKKNTNYFAQGNITGFTGSIYDSIVSTYIGYVGGVFNTGNLEEVAIIIQNGNASATTGYFDHIMLTEGTTPPTEYKPCRIERCVIEGKFADGDKVAYKDGKVSGLLNWKHPSPLYGKDYNWYFTGSASGYKAFAMSGFADGRYGVSGNVLVKYDGKILREIQTQVAPDDFLLWKEPTANTLFVNISNADTGWAEAIAPNADEVKAFMNGWKAIAYTEGRYIQWWNITDTSNPKTSITGYPNNATTLTVASNNTTNITVSNSSIFKAGDRISVYGDTLRTVSSISGNVLTLDGAVPNGFAVGNVVSRLDTTTDTRNIIYCKNNVAPNYEGYQLHYKLANPEPITDVNTHIHGDIPKLDNGDNYLYLDYGYVLGEVANPTINPYDSSQYWINDGTYIPPSKVKNKLESFIAFYRNYVYDNKWTVIAGTGSFGNQDAYITTTNYDTNATYTVDYQILKTMHTTPTSISLAYQTDILNAIADLAEIVGNKQAKDSSLDKFIDMSLFESRQIAVTALARGFYTSTMASGGVSLASYIPFMSTKKTIPIITISNATVRAKDSTGTSLVVGTQDMYIVLASNVTRQGFIVFAHLKPSTTSATNALNNGGFITFDWIADCRGRL